MSEMAMMTPVVQVLRHRAEELALAADHKASIEALDPQIAELEARLADLKAQHAEQGRHYSEAMARAELYGAMAHGICEARGLTMPELPAEPQPVPGPWPIDPADPLTGPRLRRVESGGAS